MVVAIVAVVLVVAITFVIAAAFIGRESALLATREHRPTYRLPDAVAFVADKLDEVHAGRLTHDELGDLLMVHIERLQDQAEAGVGAREPEVTDDPGVVAVAAAAAQRDMDVPLDTVMSVMSLHLDYLRALGALEQLEA